RPVHEHRAEEGHPRRRLPGCAEGAAGDGLARLDAVVPGVRDLERDRAEVDDRGLAGAAEDAAALQAEVDDDVDGDQRDRHQRRVRRGDRVLEREQGAWAYPARGPPQAEAASGPTPGRSCGTCSSAWYELRTSGP